MAKNATRTPDRNAADARTASGFLLWCRENGYVVASVQVGEFRADVYDDRRAGAKDTKPEKPPRDVHDAFADEMNLPRPSDAEPDDDDEEKADA